MPETEEKVLSGIREGMGKGKLLQVSKGPRNFVLFFNLSLFTNKLRGDEVIRSCTISNGRGKKRRGSPARMEYDRRSVLKDR